MFGVEGRLWDGVVTPLVHVGSYGVLQCRKSTGLGVWFSDCDLEQVTEPLCVVQWDEIRGSSKSRWETEDQRGGALLKITQQI